VNDDPENWALIIVNTLVGTTSTGAASSRLSTAMANIHSGFEYNEVGVYQHVNYRWRCLLIFNYVGESKKVKEKYRHYCYTIAQHSNFSSSGESAHDAHRTEDDSNFYAFLKMSPWKQGFRRKLASRRSFNTLRC
jgi:hypothetical protein